MFCSPSLRVCLIGFVSTLVTVSMAQGITLEGDPSISTNPGGEGGGPITNALIDNISAIPNGPVEITNIDAPTTFDIVLRDMQHLEIFDNGTGSGYQVAVNMGVTHDLTANDQGGIFVLDAFFSDENGDRIGPTLTPALNPTILLPIDVGALMVFDVPPSDPVILHDFHITIEPSIANAPGAQIFIDSINFVRILDIGPDSNVGVWTPGPGPGPRGAVPEPVTAMLGLMGLGVLGMATRRRAA